MVRSPVVNKELLRYLVSGLTAVATDLVSYSWLLPYVGPSPAKTMSFVAATVVAYTLNKFWTFKSTAHSWSEMLKFAALYSASLLTNVVVNKTSIYVIEVAMQALLPFEYQVSWLMATGASTVLNYVGQKFWVFRRTVKHVYIE